jgi:1-pyrroline-5-carboxylate dehydrogenase
MSQVRYATLSSDENTHAQYENALKEIEKEFGQHHSMFIDGRKVNSPKGEFEVRSPIDRSIVLGHFQRGTVQHAKEAIASCKRTFTQWSNLDSHERNEIFRRAADLADADVFPLSALMTYEVGKNRFESISEVCVIADLFRYYAGQMEANNGFIKETCPGSKSVLRPHGVWVVISPFNFPMSLAAHMITGALITGNAVVFKPTSQAPFSALRLYDIYVRAGVSPGAINYITVPGSDFGEEVSRNPDIAGVAFTGSKQIGMGLYRDFVQFQSHPKPFISEMGSKNPVIVTANADLDKAVEGVVRGAFGYAGQKCSATSRLYVEANVKDTFLKRLVERTAQIVIGDPRRRDVFLGPVINEIAVDNYQRLVTLAKKDGGRILVGGQVVKSNELSSGYFVAPTIITELPNEHPLFKQELFLPILLINEFENFQEALRKANDTDYGLTAGIFSEDEQEIDQFFREIEFGVAFSNRKMGATTGAWAGLQSFCGWKASGCSSKGTGGPYYLPQFLREQSQTRVM